MQKAADPLLWRFSNYHERKSVMDIADQLTRIFCQIDDFCKEFDKNIFEYLVMALPHLVLLTKLIYVTKGSPTVPQDAIS